VLAMRLMCRCSHTSVLCQNG